MITGKYKFQNQVTSMRESRCKWALDNWAISSNQNYSFSFDAYCIAIANRRGRVGFRSSQSGCGLKMGHFKWVKNKFRSIRLHVRSGWPIFFTWIFFFFNKENNMYLPFGKSYNKLLNVKCITLNSPLILRMNSVKLINISIILKLYKS